MNARKADAKSGCKKFVFFGWSTLKDTFDRKLGAGDTAYLAQYAGSGTRFPQNELDRFQDIDGSVVRRVTRSFVWLELTDGNKSRVPRKWIAPARHSGTPVYPAHGAATARRPAKRTRWLLAAGGRLFGPPLVDAFEDKSGIVYRFVNEVRFRHARLIHISAAAMRCPACNAAIHFECLDTRLPPSYMEF